MAPDGHPVRRGEPPHDRRQKAGAEGQIAPSKGSRGRSRLVRSPVGSGQGTACKPSRDGSGGAIGRARSPLRAGLGWQPRGGQGTDRPTQARLAGTLASPRREARRAGIMVEQGISNRIQLRAGAAYSGDVAPPGLAIIWGTRLPRCRADGAGVVGAWSLRRRRSGK